MDLHLAHRSASLLALHASEMAPPRCRCRPRRWGCGEEKEVAPLGILSTVPLGVVRAGAEDGLGLLLGALLGASADAADSWFPAAGPVPGPPPVERSVLVILEGEDASDLLALARQV